MSVFKLSVEDLAQQCAEETHKFTRQEENDTRYCFELLRRALVDDVAEAFTHVYRVYEPMVKRWVFNHSQFQHTGESVEYFASHALSNFYFALRGQKFNRFEFLAQVLQYMKLCVHTAIAEYMRAQQRSKAVPVDEYERIGYSSNMEARQNHAEIWTYICDLLADEDDEKLADYVFVQGLKPAEIAGMPNCKYGSPREVSVALQRIRRTLRKDHRLRDWLGADL